MVTPTEISAGILAITRAGDLLKKANDLSEKIQNVEIREIIVQLRESLVDTKSLLIDSKTEIVNLKEENENLREEIRKLQQQKEEESKLILKDGLYYTEDGDGGFCTCCYDKNKEKILVTELSSTFRLVGRFKCPSCKSTFL